jgi:hypothetical protein
MSFCFKPGLGYLSNISVKWTLGGAAYLERQSLVLRLIVFLALLSFLAPVRADSFYTLVGFECDQNADRLTVRYRGAYNEEGESMVQRKSSTEWQPGRLIASMKDDDHIGELRTIRASCKLRHAVYQLRIGPTPGNFNIQGRCGASIAAWVEVRRGKEVVLPRYELEGDCHDAEAPVTTEIVFSGPSAPPEFKRLLPAEFYR